MSFQQSSQYSVGFSSVEVRSAHCLYPAWPLQGAAGYQCCADLLSPAAVGLYTALFTCGPCGKNKSMLLQQLYLHFRQFMYKYNKSNNPQLTILLFLKHSTLVEIIKEVIESFSKKYTELKLRPITFANVNNVLFFVQHVLI